MVSNELLWSMTGALPATKQGRAHFRPSASAVWALRSQAGALLTHRSDLFEVDLPLVVLVENAGMAFWVHVAEREASC